MLPGQLGDRFSPGEHLDGQPLPLLRQQSLGGTRNTDIYRSGRDWAGERREIALRDRDVRSSLTIHVCFLRETVFEGTNNPIMEETGSLENPIPSGKCYLELNRAENRFTPQLVGFLRAVLERTVLRVLAASPQTVDLLNKFTSVRIGDSSTIALPDELADQFPGCGGILRGAGRDEDPPAVGPPHRLDPPTANHPPGAPATLPTRSPRRFRPPDLRIAWVDGRWAYVLPELGFGRSLSERTRMRGGKWKWYLS